MRKGKAALRALILLVAFSIGLAGQAFALAPTAMVPSNEQDQAVAASMPDMQSCSDCAGGNSSGDHSKTQPSSCTLAICSVSVSPAILPPQGPATFRTQPATFIRSLNARVGGISIRPDLGPPRPSHHL